MSNTPSPQDQPQLDAAAILGADTAQTAEDSPANEAVAQRIILQHTGGVSRVISWGLAWTGWTGLIVASIIILYLWIGRNEYYDTSGGITESFYSGAASSSDKIAIITISGVIMEGDGYVKHQIDRVRDDDHVKAVVIRVDSPGGTVTGSDYIYHHLKKLREEKNIPVVVSMGSIAASGGYYVSMAVGGQENSIYAEPTTTTGSIGVIIPHYDLSGLLDEYNVKDDSIASHPRKQMLSMTRPIPPDQREILQGYVNESFERFKSIVRDGRPGFRRAGADDKQPIKLRAAKGNVDLATGEIFTAYKAQEYGLVDRIGFIEDAIERAAVLAQLDKDKVRVIRYNRPSSLLDVAGLATARSNSLDLETLFELSTPRAYYLATSLPPLVTSRRAD